MPTSEIRELTNHFVEQLLPVRIYLFGSFADSTYTEESDFDFYIIVHDAVSDISTETTKAYKSIRKVKQRPVDIVVGTVSRFEARKEIPSIENEVYRKGVQKVSINKNMGCVMIRIYRDRSKFKEENILLDNEAFFNNNVSPKDLNKASLRIMKDIDKADLIDSNIGTIQTPYGITSIDSLSTGCKTVINYIVIASNREIYKDVKAICATECGWNALEELFEQIESMGYDIGVIIEHDNKLYNCSDRKYCIDDTTIIDSMLEY